MSNLRSADRATDRPPPGIDDVYSAETQVGTMPAALLESLKERVSVGNGRKRTSSASIRAVAVAVTSVAVAAPEAVPSFDRFDDEDDGVTFVGRQPSMLPKVAASKSTFALDSPADAPPVSAAPITRLSAPVPPPAPALVASEPARPSTARTAAYVSVAQAPAPTPIGGTTTNVIATEPAPSLPTRASPWPRVAAGAAVLVAAGSVVAAALHFLR